MQVIHAFEQNSLMWFVVNKTRVTKCLLACYHYAEMNFHVQHFIHCNYCTLSKNMLPGRRRGAICHPEGVKRDESLHGRHSSHSFRSPFRIAPIYF